MSEAFDRRGQRFGGGSFDWILARRVDVRHKKCVRIVEGAGKLLHQVMCTAVAMWLKQHYDTSAAGTDFRCRQGRLHFGRMVAIVVNHHYATSFTFELKSPSGSGETTQRFRDLDERHIQFKSNRYSRKRVVNVV